MDILNEKINEIDEMMQLNPCKQYDNKMNKTLAEIFNDGWNECLTTVMMILKGELSNK